MKHEKPVIVVHGGAGKWLRIIKGKEDEELVLKALTEALELGYDYLLRGHTALEAVIESIRCMEDSGVFNAGVGSVLNLKGEVEMDAGLMDGKDLKVGAVASVRAIKNPILLAHEVMRRTDHVLIVGKYADELGMRLGLEKYPGPIERQRLRYERYLKEMLSGRSEYWSKNLELIKQIPDLVGGTVGAVALDKDGNVAAGSSTGGVILKLPGRVGDSSIPGAGFYADSRVGAASATGLGEFIVRSLLSKTAIDLMSLGLNAELACSTAIRKATILFGEGTAGLICLDIYGYVGMDYNTEGMARGVMSSYMSKPLVKIFR